MDLLAPALKVKQITEFRLERNEFVNNEGNKFTIECIKHNNELKHVEWVNNQIDNKKDAMLLVDSIIDNPSIDSVRIKNCLGGEHNINSYEVVRPIFATDRIWDQLDFEGNNIQTQGHTEIPDYIASNPPLNALYLAGNKLNDNDAILIARALKQNNHLKQIRLDDNDITETGYNTLCNSFYDFTSLNSISDCNHTCHVEDIRLCRCSSFENSSRRPIKETRARKIYYTLSTWNEEGSNVQHLNSEFDDEDDADSLKVVPQVLAAIQHYHDEYNHGKRYKRDNDAHKRVHCPQPHHPLSITYEVLRGWKLPELFEKWS